VPSEGKLDVRHLNSVQSQCPSLAHVPPRGNVTMLNSEMTSSAPGLHIYKPERCDEGYTLFSTVQQEDCYLIDIRGQLIQRWPTAATNLTRLLPDGHLI